jgi:hypothetical protein
MANPGEHNFEMGRDTFIPCGIRVRLLFAFDMLWIEGLVDDAGGCTECVFRDPPGHKMIHVERNRPNRNCFVTFRNRFESGSHRTSGSLTFVCLACKSSIRYPQVVSPAVQTSMGL